MSDLKPGDSWKAEGCGMGAHNPITALAALPVAYDPFLGILYRRPGYCEKVEKQLSHLKTQDLEKRGDKRVFVDSLHGEREALTKNLDYALGKEAERITSHPAFDEDRYWEMMYHHNDSRGFSAPLEAFMKHAHVKDGAQMIVCKDVSDDMSNTDMEEVNIVDIPWRSKSTEFYFEDPNLPSLLVYKGTLDGMATTCGLTSHFRDFADPAHECPANDDSVNFWVETRTGAGFAFRAREGNWDELINAENRDIPSLGGTVAFSNEEWETLRSLYQLCIKVLVYASIPHFMEPITSKKEFKAGGKPGVKHRPKRPAFRVVYLPELRREATEAAESEGKHKFRGRRGFMRKYRHARYVNLQGKWRFIHPVPGPDGTIPKIVYKVRKPRNSIVQGLPVPGCEN